MSKDVRWQRIPHRARTDRGYGVPVHPTSGHSTDLAYRRRAERIPDGAEAVAVASAGWVAGFASAQARSRSREL